MVSVSRDNRQRDILAVDRLVSAGMISAVSELPQRVDVVHTVEITCTMHGIDKDVIIKYKTVIVYKSRDFILHGTSMYRYSMPIK